MIDSALANIPAASAPITGTHTRGRRSGMNREVVGLTRISQQSGAPSYRRTRNDAMAELVDLKCLQE